MNEVQEEKPKATLKEKINTYFLAPIKNIPKKISKWCDYYSAEIFFGSIFFVLGIALLGSFYHIGRETTININNDKSKIEVGKKISQFTNLTDFTFDAFYPTTEGERYIIQVYGYFKNEQQTPQYCCVGYEVEEDLYNLTKKWFKTEFVFDDSGNPKGASNTHYDAECCPKTKARRRYNDILKELKKLSEYDPLYILDLSIPSKQVNKETDNPQDELYDKEKVVEKEP